MSPMPAQIDLNVADEAPLRLMESHLSEIKAQIQAKETIWRTLPGEIAVLNCDLNRLLAQLQALRDRMRS